MSVNRISLRQMALGAAASLAGGAAGALIATIAIDAFAGSPPWELPALIVGALAGGVVVVLLLPAFGRTRDHAEHPRSSRAE